MVKQEKSTKIIFEVDPALHDRQKIIPWGIKTQIMGKLLERLLDSVDEHGSAVYGFILDGQFTIQPDGWTRDEQTAES